MNNSSKDINIDIRKIIKEEKPQNIELNQKTIHFLKIISFLKEL